jgi:hypothetical protein
MRMAQSFAQITREFWRNPWAVIGRQALGSDERCAIIVCRPCGVRGQQADVEAMRVTAIEFAHQEGYARSESDATIGRVGADLDANDNPRSRTIQPR